ncbi:MAG: helix-turn-helix domain-containing protein [Phycisphaera sp.]|nr:helix-turn-helix domain-containing protein [Phycisphaera sp.]
MLRDRRTQLGLTLSQVAERVDCAKSYLSEIETGVRARPPGTELLAKLEAALGLDAGQLVEIANWEATPESVRRQVASSRQAAIRLRELLASTQTKQDALDRAFGSGELRRLVESLDPTLPRGLEVVSLPREVPVINRVTAGYPSEFTDLGYPARVADEYVRVPDLDDADAFGARVVGDSMEPEYREGDVVVFSPKATVISGSDCFVRLEPDQETTFKRVYFEKDASGHELIRLQPLNNAYPPVVVPRDRVAGLYSGVSVVRSLMARR